MKIFLLYFTVASMLFLPDASSGFRVDDITILFLFLLLVYQRKVKIHTVIYPIIIVIIYLLIISASLLYNLNFFDYAASNFGYSLNNSLDLYIKEIIRALKILVFIAVASNIKFTEVDLEKFLTYFLRICYLLAIIGIMQYSNFLGINQFIANNYSPGDVHNDLISYYYIISGGIRISTTFYNPNIYAAFVLIPLSLSLKRAILNRKLIPWIGVGIFVINIFLTQSRTGIIAAAVIFFSYFFYKSVYIKKINIAQTFLILLAVYILYFLINSLNLSITARLQETFTSGVIASSGRAPIIEQVKEILSISPIFGYSPIVTNNIASDNELKIFIHYGGILGLFFYFFLIIMLYKGVVRSSVTHFNKFFLLTLIACIVLVGLSNGFIISNRIFPVFILIYFLIIRSVRPQMNEE